jgi:hypothetical protein
MFSEFLLVGTLDGKDPTTKCHWETRLLPPYLNPDGYTPFSDTHIIIIITTTTTIISISIILIIYHKISSQ